jgi:hypothetical protein
MLLQIIVGVAWLLWLSSGTAGLQNGLIGGALLAIGLGVMRFLDTLGKEKGADTQADRRLAYEYKTPSRSTSRNRGMLPSSNWNLSRFSGPEDSAPLPRFDRR